MTSIDKQVSRSCPGVTNPEGRELQVRLHDDPDDGATLSLKWRGLRKDAEIDIALEDLMAYAEGKIGGDEPEPGHGAASPGSPTKEASPGSNAPTGAASPGTSPKGTDKSEWCKFDDLLSRVHIIGGLDMSTRLILITTIKELRAHHAWLLSGGNGSWENFKAQHLAPKE